MYYLRLMLISCLTCTVVNSSIAQTLQGADSRQLIESRELTARVVQLYGEHKYDEALPLAKRALELGEAALGKTDSRLLGLLINLGDLYVAKIDFDDARTSFERALTIAQTNFGPGNLNVTRPLDELGYLMSNKGDYRKAADLFSRSLAIKEKLLPADDIEIPRTAFTLGDIYRKSHEYSQAELFYQQAIRRYEKSGRKPELVEVLRRYLIVLTAENKKDEAASVQTRLIELSTEAGVIEGGVVNGWAVKLIQPGYPADALSAHASGQVQVEVLIDEKGNVASAHAISGHPLLQAAAVAAAQASKFTPTLRSGAAVKVKGTIIYNFVRR